MKFKDYSKISFEVNPKSGEVKSHIEGKGSDIIKLLVFGLEQVRQEMGLSYDALERAIIQSLMNDLKELRKS